MQNKNKNAQVFINLNRSKRRKPTTKTKLLRHCCWRPTTAASVDAEPVADRMGVCVCVCGGGLHNPGDNGGQGVELGPVRHQAKIEQHGFRVVVRAELPAT